MFIDKTPKWLRIGLWAIQITLSVMLIWAAYMKLFQTLEALSAVWPWTGQVPSWLVKLTGIFDLLGGLGLTLPALLNVRPALTYLASLAVVVLMVCAMTFHMVRGESGVFNVVIGGLAATLQLPKLFSSRQA